MGKKREVSGKVNVAKQNNRPFYWYRRNAIQTDSALYTKGRMLLQMSLLQPYIMALSTQADDFGVSTDTARRVRRLAIKPFTYKGIEAPLFDKEGRGFVKHEVEGQSWNDRFNACPHIKSIYFRTVTLRIDLAAVREDRTAYVSNKGIAEMIEAKTPRLVWDALNANRDKDNELFEVKSLGGEIYAYKPRLITIEEKPAKPAAVVDPNKLDRSKARFIIETEFGLKGSRALAFVDEIVVPAHRLQLKGTFEELVRALCKMRIDLLDIRRKAANRHPDYDPNDIIKLYIDWIDEQRHNTTIPPTIGVLDIKVKWFEQCITLQSIREQTDIIRGEQVVG